MVSPPPEQLPVDAQATSSLPDDSADERFFVPWRSGCELPTVCPVCLLPGSRPEPLPGSERTILYCDACADAHERALTKGWAIQAAASLMALFTGTGFLLALGKHFLLAQIAGIALSGLTLPLVLAAVGRLPSFALPLRILREFPKDWRTAEGTKPPAMPNGSLEVTTRGYAALLGSYVRGRRISRLHDFRTFLVAPGVGLAFWALVQNFANADLWVFHHEPDVVLVVDERLEGPVAPTLEESPYAGLHTSVLAGLRPVALLSQRGRILLKDDVRLLPGHSYLFGSPPPGLCFYWESMSYGEGSAKPLRRSLGRGPWIELPERPDRWLAPLPEGGPQLTTGGRRHGVRLLRCGASGEPEQRDP